MFRAIFLVTALMANIVSAEIETNKDASTPPVQTKITKTQTKTSGSSSNTTPSKVKEVDESSVKTTDKVVDDDWGCSNCCHNSTLIIPINTARGEGCIANSSLNWDQKCYTW